MVLTVYHLVPHMCIEILAVFEFSATLKKFCWLMLLLMCYVFIKFKNCKDFKDFNGLDGLLKTSLTIKHALLP
jgi:hypothetical protein